jgi:lipid II:glycine glycyltransferase (peptidoglycan interpeptide bridge formation enzyme)
MDTKIIDSKSTWENFLSEHPEANFLQSWYWGEFQEALKRKIFRIGVFDKNKLAGVMFAYVEPAKRGKFLVVPGGPILDWSEEQAFQKAVTELRSIAKQNKCDFVRVRPQLEEGELSKKLFESAGFRNAPMYLHAELTSELDITPTADEILSNMRKTTRYEIKKAQKIGIKVGSEYSKKYADTFIRLQDETAKRQGFVPFPKDFLLKQFDVFIKNNKALLYTAEYKNKVLAQAFIIFYGKEAVYNYGASSLSGRDYPGAYLIQWEAILEAKKRNIPKYNLWGVAPPEATEHRFAGISIFKRGFGGMDVHYLRAQDLVISRKKYLVNYFVEKVRRKTRRV